MPPETFSFEEAGQPSPATFSFEEAKAPSTFSFDEASQPAGPFSKAGFKQAFSDITNLPALTAAGYKVATGAVGFPVSGISGLYALIENEIMKAMGRTPRLQEPGAVVPAVQEWFSQAAPVSEAAERLAEGAAKPFELLHKGARIAGETAEARGQQQMQENRLAWRGQIASHPATLAALETAIEGGAILAAPPVIGRGLRWEAERGAARPRPTAPPVQTGFIEGEIGPPPTGTSSGVPLPLDKLIAGAERDWQIPQPPKPKQIVRQAAQEGLEARVPPLPEAEFTPQGAEARPRPAGELPEPPAAEAPSQPAPRQRELGYQPLDWSRADEIAATRVVRSETLEGGRAPGKQATVNQALSWLEDKTGRSRPEVDAAIFDAGRERETVENKQRAFNQLYSVFDQQANLRTTYPEFYTERGQVDKRAVETVSREYNTYVSTQMNAARRANEGRDTALHPGSFDEFRRQGGEPAPMAPLPEPLTPPESLELRYRGPEPTERGVGEIPRPPAEVSRETRAPAGEIPPPPIAKAVEPTKPATADPRLKHEGYAEQLRELGREAGQEETGGRMIKDETNRGPDTGERGRIVWIAQPWYREMQRMPEFKSSPEGVRTIIEKAIAGEKLGPKQQKILGYLLDEVQYRLEGEPPTGGGAKLSANPMFDPAAWQDVMKPLVAVNEAGKRLMNRMQAMPESAYPAAAAGYDFALASRTAHYMAQTDRARKYADKTGIEKDYREAVAKARTADPRYQERRPATYPEAVAETERARIAAATATLQRELLNSGAAIMPGRGQAIEGYVTPQNYKAFTTSGGRVMMLRRDAAPVLEQMVSGYDWAAERRYMASVAGKIEQGSHGLSGILLAIPTFHAVTAGGRIAPAAINLPRNNLLRFSRSAREAMNNRAEMQDMMQHGVVFWPRRGTMEPSGARAGFIEKALKEHGLGGVYEGYQWFHNDLLGGAVNWMATSYYQWRLNQLKEAHPGALSAKQLDTYKTMAGRDASLAVANLAKEEGTRSWFRLLGSLAFSRGLQVNTIRMATRALEGDKMLEAVARKNGMSVEQAREVMQKNKRFLGRQLVKDYLAMQVIANAINYFTTEMEDEPNGVKGGHFVWENQGSDKGQWFLPTNIFIKAETDEKGEQTGRGIYISTPFRSARDIVEYAILPYEIMMGAELRLLKNKMSVPLKWTQETLQGKDWAGRPIAGARGVAEHLVTSVTPSPFEEIPRFAFEAFAQDNPTYFSEGLAKVFGQGTFGLKVAGMQPRISSTDAETTMLQSKGMKEEDRVWGRARKIKKDIFGMADETRQSAIDSVMADADKAGFDAKGKQALRRYLATEGVTRGAQRGAQRFLNVNPQYQREGEIPAPPRP